MAITFDSPTGDVIDDPRGKAILDELIPGMTTNPSIALGRPIPLRAIMSFPQNGFSPELQAEVERRINELSE